MNKYIDEHGENIGERILKCYERYQDNLDENPDTKEELEQEITCLLLNMKGAIEQNERDKKLLGMSRRLIKSPSQAKEFVFGLSSRTQRGNTLVKRNNPKCTNQDSLLIS